MKELRKGRQASVKADEGKIVQHDLTDYWLRGGEYVTSPGTNAIKDPMVMVTSCR